MNKNWIVAIALAGALVVPTAARAHEGHAHKVMGTVSSVEGNNVMVKTADGKTVMVMLDAEDGHYARHDEARRGSRESRRPGCRGRHGREGNDHGQDGQAGHGCGDGQEVANRAHNGRMTVREVVAHRSPFARSDR